MPAGGPIPSGKRGRGTRMPGGHTMQIPREGGMGGGRDRCADVLTKVWMPALPTGRSSSAAHKMRRLSMPSNLQSGSSAAVSPRRVCNIHVGHVVVGVGDRGWYCGWAGHEQEWWGLIGSGWWWVGVWLMLAITSSTSADPFSTQRTRVNLCCTCVAISLILCCNFVAV
jgi:hypothetical protein